MRLNGPQAAGKKVALNADAGPKLTKATMNEIQLGKVKLADAISANNVTVEGRRQSVDDFVGLLDTFQLWFNIVTP
ncbi:hypothetical protein EB75_15655 [Mycobacterium sp. ST-F2]|uniref:alkyl sulfatase C-terminal domain-containing protein n=1 Tax=Mycobacterium sp. ST-F2 TaxID=1490484 RepID=UPI00093DA833|nr:alkyl sulfatase C-terminal domain-containing protein [Mycobacterium sp. ST-F2]OKH85726.1 hypothetical protein EB75_15655 [Mycobacterium sp. ST-F2]